MAKKNLKYTAEKIDELLTKADEQMATKADLDNKLGKTETAADSEKLGGFPADNFVRSNGGKYNVIAADSEKLGGFPADNFVRSNGGTYNVIAKDSERLGGFPADGFVRSNGGTYNVIAKAIEVNGISPDTKYGKTAGIIQSSSLADNPIINAWFNRLKICYNDSAGYFTELAMPFEDGHRIYFRTCYGGSTSEWRPLAFLEDVGKGPDVTVLLSPAKRIASANIPVVGDAGVRHYLVSSAMTSGHPFGGGSSGSILNFDWDTTAGYNKQLAIGAELGIDDPALRLKWRAQNEGVWSDWKTVLFADSKVDNWDVTGTLTAATVEATTLKGSLDGTIKATMRDTNLFLLGFAQEAGAAAKPYVTTQVSINNGVLTIKGLRVEGDVEITGNTVIGGRLTSAASYQSSPISTTSEEGEPTTEEQLRAQISTLEERIEALERLIAQNNG